MLDSSADEVRLKGELRGMTTNVELVGEDVYVCPFGDTVLPEEMSSEGGEERRTIEWAHLENEGRWVDG